jgi:hypothetical protein
MKLSILIIMLIAFIPSYNNTTEFKINECKSNLYQLTNLLNNENSKDWKETVSKEVRESKKNCLRIIDRSLYLGDNKYEIYVAQTYYEAGLTQIEYGLLTNNIPIAYSGLMFIDTGNYYMDLYISEK